MLSFFSLFFFLLIHINNNMSIIRLPFIILKEKNMTRPNTGREKGKKTGNRYKTNVMLHFLLKIYPHDQIRRTRI